MQGNDSDVLYTIDEVMELLKLTRATVHGLIKSGKLKAVKIGRLLRVPRKFYLEFLEKSLVENDIKK